MEGEPRVAPGCLSCLFMGDRVGQVDLRARGEALRHDLVLVEKGDRAVRSSDDSERTADGRWTVDAWQPLEGRTVNAGLRFRF